MSIAIDPTMMPNAFRHGDNENLPESAKHLIERRGELLAPAYRLFYKRPIEFVRGEGCWLYAVDGTCYLDAYNNVAGVGHANPVVVAAVANQLATLNTHTRYLDGIVLDYAERLLATFPPDLGRVMFTCTGSEANDLGLRVAQAHTGARGVIVTANAYHGVTEATAAASPALGPYRGACDHIRVVRPPLSSSDADGSARFVEEMRGAIASLQRDGHGVAAFLCDTIFSTDGVLPSLPGLTEAIDLVRAAGGLYFADEVQAGFGRVGSAFWGFARHQLVPDMVSMGKPMGNGYPVAALVARPSVLETFSRNNRYFNTFGGSSVAAAAAMATLGEIQSDGFLDRVDRTGAYLQEGLNGLRQHHRTIKDVRGTGLSVGVEIASGTSSASERAERIVNFLADHRVLISATGPQANVLKIRPPLVFGAEQVDLLISTLDQALKAIE